MSSSKGRVSGSSGSSSRRGNSGLSFVDFFDADKSFAINFQYDVSLPPVTNAVKLLTTPVDMSVFLNPLSAFELGDLQTASLPDFDAPVMDLISRFGRERIDHPLNEDEDDAAEDLDTLKKKQKRTMISLVAPTYVNVELTVDELNEAGRGGPVSRQPVAQHVNQRKTYSVMECFTRGPETYSHPLKPNVTAQNCLSLVPEGRSINSNPGMRLTPVAFDTDPVTEDPLTHKNATYNKNYPKLVLAPLAGQEFTSISACQLYGDVAEQRAARFIDQANPKDSMDLRPEDQQLLSQFPASLALMPRLRAYQSMTKREAVAEQSILVSLSKDAGATTAGLTLLNPRIQLTKAVTKVQNYARRFPEALAVARLPKETQKPGQRAAAKLARALLGSAVISSSPNLAPAPANRHSVGISQLLRDEDDDEDEAEEDFLPAETHRQGGRLRGLQDDDDEF